MDELREAATVLGLSVHGAARASDAAYLSLIREGLPLRSLMRVAAFYAPNDGLFKYQIVPKASLQRASGQRLNSSQSVRLTRLASVWALAHRIWKTDQATRDFLFRPHSLLENQRPVDLVLKDELGAQQVRSVLGQLDAGSAV